MLAISIPAYKDQPAMTTEHVTVDPPKHPLPALATFELRAYRRELERAIALLDGPDPVRRDMQARLDDVLAEQDERRRLARA
jgi:hypothetical protein